MNEKTNASVEIWLKRNTEAIENAEIVLLACQPSQAGAILGDAGMVASLANKLLLSICWLAIYQASAANLRQF